MSTCSPTAVSRTPVHRNPDLVERLQSGALLAEINPATIYGGGAAGYTDCPRFTETSGS